MRRRRVHNLFLFWSAYSVCVESTISLVSKYQVSHTTLVIQVKRNNCLPRRLGYCYCDTHRAAAAAAAAAYLSPQTAILTNKMKLYGQLATQCDLYVPCLNCSMRSLDRN